MNSPRELVTVTALEAATVFEGEQTSYRYDLTGTGIVEGWALEAVVEQIRQAAGAHWPDVDVELLGEQEAVNALRTALSGYGMSVLTPPGAKHALEQTTPHPSDRAAPPPARDLQDGAEAPERWGDDREYPYRDMARGDAFSDTSQTESASAPPRPPGKYQSKAGRLKVPVALHPLHGVLAVVVVVIAILSWLVIDATMRQSGGELTSADAVAATSAPESGLPNGTQSTQKSAQATPSPVAKETVMYEHANIRVELPRGYTLAPAEHLDDVIMATGPDPNLRILMSTTLTAGASTGALLEEVRATVAQDPTLSLESGGQEITYLEQPGDGSQVQWHVRVEGVHMLSVGCHSKKQPTIPQKATCRMAVESFHHK